MRDAAAVLGAAVGAEGLDAVAAEPEELVRTEDERVLANLMQPYEDQVPQVLQQGCSRAGRRSGGAGNRLRRSGNSDGSTW